MKVIVLSDYGYDEALFGLGLSHGVTSELDFSTFTAATWWPNEEWAQPDPRFIKTQETANRLSNRDGGHNKFLESIQVWLDIVAPRYWWQQFDTYRVGVTKQSESTMHTLLKKPLTQDSFEGGINPTILEILEGYRRRREWGELKKNLCEAFLQRRVVCCNYKSLRGVILQRSEHRLGEWQILMQALKDGLTYPELLFKGLDDA
jgi:hypothetical protein